MTRIRGYNPIWSLVDLVGNQLDDTYFLFVLQNELPYLPATVYHTPSGTPWTQPIRFLANGTLPVDIFWTDDAKIKYRLEIRKGNTNADPLIYLIENYSPTDSSGSISLVALPTDNQITTPQFADINFEPPFQITAGSAQTVNVAPGWDLVLTGSGNVTLEREAKNNSDATTESTNAPYALHLTLSGWSTAVLRQRFQQNGTLWAGKHLSAVLTAKSIAGSTPAISAVLRNSMGTLVSTVISSVNINSSYAQYSGSALIPESENTNLPPSAWMDYEIVLPNSEIYLTSIQLIAGDTPDLNVAYEQTTVDRQIDHTFHNYRDSLLHQAKNDILTGWDFGLNPWQSRTTAQTNVAANEYTAEQTIVIQQKRVESGTGNHVSVGRAAAGDNYGLTVQAATATNQFALVQYLDPNDIRPYWGRKLSSFVRLKARKQGANPLRVKMKLWYKAGLPGVTANTVPVATWLPNSTVADVHEPDLTANGWTAINSVNNPVYFLENGENILHFNGFTLPASTNANMTLAVVIYTMNPMISTGTPDNIIFNKINLVPNDFAIEDSGLTFTETLKRCEYHYRKSFPHGTVPAVSAGFTNASFFLQAFGPSIGGIVMIVNYGSSMRVTPSVTLFNPISANNLIRNVNDASDYASTLINSNSPNGFTAGGTSGGTTVAGSETAVHWVSNARLGV